MELNLENNINKTKVATSNTINNFIEDLEKSLEKNNTLQTETKQYNFLDQSERYKDYWKYQSSLEDNVCAKLGISRSNREIKYFDRLYEVHEDDEFVFLDDITESNYSFEDIDFVADNYKGEGTYKVIDGEYTKISDEFYSEKE